MALLSVAGRCSHQQLSSSGRGFAPVTSRSVFTGVPVLRASPVRTSRLNAAPRGLTVEANLFSRVVRVIKSYANTLVTAAEDPEKILEQATEDMQGDLIKLRSAAAEVKASQMRLEQKYDLAQKTADDWYRRAELALTKGEEDLARDALSRRKAYQDNANLLKSQLTQQARASDTIIANLRVMETKLSEAKMKKDTLKARAQSAKSAKAINDMVLGLDTSSAMAAFEKMEDKVLSLEAEAEAATLLSAPDDVESKFRALEGSNVDDDLNQLRTALGSGSKPRAELPPGRPLRDAFDAELDEMRRNRNRGGN